MKIEGVELPDYDLADIEALQALNAGTANDIQQKRVLKWIVETVCGTYVWAYKDSERETLVSLGKQMVGQIIAGQTKLKLSDLRRKHG